jgi:hypothetical protein
VKELKRAEEPFSFYTRLSISELTGFRASTLKELAALMKEVPGSCIYHHTHRFLQQHQYLSPEPPNDFAYWVSNVLGEKELGEDLASVDTVQFNTIASLRERLVSIIENYLGEDPTAELRFAHEGEAFHFIKSVSFIIPTNYVVYDLREFADVLKKITVDSIYFHVFEARLRVGKEKNDFSYWIDTSMGDKKLASEITRLDPYTYTLEELRQKMIRIIEKRIGE